MNLKAYLIFTLLIFGFACPYFFSADSNLSGLLGVVILILWGLITEWMWSNYIKSIFIKLWEKKK